MEKRILLSSPTMHGEEQAFIKEALMLKEVLSLCSSMVKEHMRLEAAFLYRIAEFLF